MFHGLTISDGARIFFGGRSLSPSLPFLLPFLPPSLSPLSPFPPSPSLSRPSQARSQDCQNEEADRSSAPPLSCPPLPCPPVPSLPLPLEVGPRRNLLSPIASAGSAETTVAEGGRNLVAGLWGHTLGENSPQCPCSVAKLLW